MKIIEWNCQGAFRKKNDRVLSLSPDILIVSECESEKKLKFGDLTPMPNDFYWFGDSDNKGIGIFSFSEYKFELLNCFNPNCRYVIPLKVSDKYSSFILFAVWAMDNKEKPESRYIGQVWNAINYYSTLLSKPCIFTGDFNSNTIWDINGYVGNHSQVVSYLEQRNIYSLYHSQERVEQGKELHPTFHLYRKLNKPYHIDYVFASQSIIKSGYSISVGKVEDWIDISDHVPLTVWIKEIPSLVKLDDSFCNIFQSNLERLSKSTRRRFADVIEVLVSESKNNETVDGKPEEIVTRKTILEKYEKLLQIDKLMHEINHK